MPGTRSFGSTNAILPGGGYSADPFRPVIQPIVPINPTEEQMRNRDKATEPVVIGPSIVQDQIDKANAGIPKLANKGAYSDETGNTYHADGSVISTVKDSENNGTDTSGKTYSPAEFYDPNNPDADWVAVQNQFAPLKAQLDADTLAQVNSIHAQFENLRQQQQEFNRRAEQSRAQALLNAGTSRYAPMDASGTMLAQTSYGLRQIANLDAKENDAIAAAKAAQASGNQKLMVEAYNIAEKARTDKQEAAQKVSDQIREATQKQAEQSLQAARDSAVGDYMVRTHETDPAKILLALNYDQNGKKTGANFTADEVSKALKAFTVAGTDAKDVDQDYRTYLFIRDHGPGLPEDIAALPPEEQYFAYVLKLHPNQAGAKKASPTPTAVPTWEEYKAAAQKSSGINYFMAPEEAQLRQQYDATYGQYKGGAKPEAFTPTELKKLEQAGLLNVSRQKQLDFLFKKKDTDTSPEDGYPTAIQ